MPLYAILPRLLNMTLTASAAIVIVLLLRLLLKKAPKVISYALWGIVLIRLLCPVSVESAFSLFSLLETPVSESGTLTSRIEYVPDSFAYASSPAAVLHDSGAEDAVRPAAPEMRTGSKPSAAAAAIAAWLWLAGVLAMTVCAAVSYIRLKRKLLTASLLRDNIYLADGIASPFVMGILRPKIYLPSSVEEREVPYIVLHEQHHIRRLDHIVKALAYAALCLHWFNPLVWLAFILASRDMEMSCDEAVVGKMGDGVLADYIASLLSLAAGRRITAGFPPAFGEGNTKDRIRNLAKWKKPALWVILAAAAVCIIAAVWLLSNPAARLDLSGVESVTVDSAAVSDKARDELVSLIVSSRRTFFPVGADDPNSLSRAIVLSCGNGDSYLLHYQYYSGYSFDPRRAGEDDTRSILTFFEAGGGKRRAWKMENDFDARLVKWLSEYASPATGAPVETQPAVSQPPETQPSQTQPDPVWEDKTVINIADPTQEADFSYAAAEEPFFEDETFIYSFGGIYSDRVIVQYADGTEEGVVSALNGGRASIADLERFGIGYRAEPKEDMLYTRILNAIRGMNRSPQPDGLLHCASFVMLDRREERSGPEPAPGQITVWGIALHMTVGFSGRLHEVSSEQTPAVLTFGLSEDGYVLTDYWVLWPPDGSGYGRDIRGRFPVYLEEEAMNGKKYLTAQKQECFDQAVRYAGIDTDAVIEKLFDTIASSSAYSSNPADYIKAHPDEVNELICYGKHTLKYIFSRFLAGGETGLYGHLMLAVFRELAPEEQIDFAADTTQAYFDRWKEQAGRVGEQYGRTWVRENQPAMYLLLEMLDGSQA